MANGCNKNKPVVDGIPFVTRPLSRIINDWHDSFCEHCGISTRHKKYFNMFGKWICDNSECEKRRNFKAKMPDWY